MHNQSIAFLNHMSSSVLAWVRNIKLVISGRKIKLTVSGITIQTFNVYSDVFV